MRRAPVYLHADVVIITQRAVPHGIVVPQSESCCVSKSGYLRFARNNSLQMTFEKFSPTIECRVRTTFDHQLVYCAGVSTRLHYLCRVPCSGQHLRYATASFVINSPVRLSQKIVCSLPTSLLLSLLSSVYSEIQCTLVVVVSPAEQVSSSLPL